MDLKRLGQLQSDASVPNSAEIWDLTSEEAANAIETLAADTARELLSTLYQEPKTASELADATDNSLQNVNYHVQNLRDANLIEVADTRYSRKGTEMKIYTPTTNAVLLLSQESTSERIKQLLARLVSGIGALAIGAIAFRSLVVGGVINVPGVAVSPGSDAGTDDAASGDGSTDGAQEDVDAQATDADGFLDADTVIETVQPLEHLPFLLDPGVVFFMGGLFLLVSFLVIGWARGRY